MYHGICLIQKYVNEGNIPAVVKKFTTEWGSRADVPEARAVLYELRDLKLIV